MMCRAVALTAVPVFRSKSSIRIANPKKLKSLHLMIGIRKSFDTEQSGARCQTTLMTGENIPPGFD